MFNVSQIADYKTALQEWLYEVQKRVQAECKEMQQYREIEEAIDQLVGALQKNLFTDAQIDEIYTTICDYQTFAANAAYVIGLRDGLAARDLIENITVQDIISQAL